MLKKKVCGGAGFVRGRKCSRFIALLDVEMWGIVRILMYAKKCTILHRFSLTKWRAKCIMIKAKLVMYTKYRWRFFINEKRMGRFC